MPIEVGEGRYNGKRVSHLLVLLYRCIGGGGIVWIGDPQGTE